MSLAHKILTKLKDKFGASWPIERAWSSDVDQDTWRGYSPILRRSQWPWHGRLLCVLLGVAPMSLHQSWWWDMAVRVSVSERKRNVAEESFELGSLSTSSFYVVVCMVASAESLSLADGSCIIHMVASASHIFFENIKFFIN